MSHRRLEQAPMPSLFAEGDLRLGPPLPAILNEAVAEIVRQSIDEQGRKSFKGQLQWWDDAEHAAITIITTAGHQDMAVGFDLILSTIGGGIYATRRLTIDALV